MSSNSKFKLSETIEDTLIDIFEQIKKIFKTLYQSIFKINVFTENLRNGNLDEYTSPYTFLTISIIVGNLGLRIFPGNTYHLLRSSSFLEKISSQLENISITDIIWDSFPVLFIIVAINFLVRRVLNSDFYDKSEKTKFTLIYIIATQLFLISIWFFVYIIGSWIFKISTIEIINETGDLHADFTPNKYVIFAYLAIFIPTVIIVYLIPTIQIFKTFNKDNPKLFSFKTFNNLGISILLPFIFLYGSKMGTTNFSNIFYDVKQLDNIDIRRDVQRPIDWFTFENRLVIDKGVFESKIIIQKELKETYVLKRLAILSLKELHFEKDTMQIDKRLKIDLKSFSKSGLIALEKNKINQLAFEAPIYNFLDSNEIKLIKQNELKSAIYQLELTPYPKEKMLDDLIESTIFLNYNNSMSY